MPTLEIKETNQTVEVKSGVPSASQLQGDPIPSNPSPGDVLRYGTEWGHARPEFPAESFGADTSNADNRPAIKSAIDAAVSAGGGVVSLRTPGVFEVQDPGQDYVFQILNDGITIYLGPGVTLKIADGQLSGSETLNIFRIGDGTTAVSNVRIFGPGTLDGNRANNSSSGAHVQGAAVYFNGPVEDCGVNLGKIIHTTRAGVSVDGESDASRASNVVVERTRFDDVGGDGFIWQRADGVKCLNNRFTNHADQQPIGPSSSTKNWEVRGNVLLFPSNTPVGTWIDIFADSGPNEGGLVEGNFVSGGHTKLEIGSGASDAVRRVTVRDNWIEDGRIAVGATATTEDIEISYNRVISASTNGVLVNSGVVDARVKHNVVSEAQENGIEVSGATNIVVAYNTCFNNGQAGTTGANLGIIGNNTTDARFIGNILYDDQGTATQFEGLRVQSATRPLIAFNHFSGHSSLGHNTIGSTDVTLIGNSGQDIGETTGTATVSSGDTSQTVTTGYHSRHEGTFSLADVQVTPTNDPTNDVGNFWIDNLVVSGGNVTFDINVGSDPGSGGATFAWTIQP